MTKTTRFGIVGTLENTSILQNTCLNRCCTAVEREVTGIQVAETRASESQPTKQLSAFSTFKFLRVHYAKLYSLSYRTYILQARRATINTVVLHNSAERERI